MYKRKTSQNWEKVAKSLQKINTDIGLKEKKVEELKQKKETLETEIERTLSNTDWFKSITAGDIFVSSDKLCYYLFEWINTGNGCYGVHKVVFSKSNFYNPSIYRYNNHSEMLWEIKTKCVKSVPTDISPKKHRLFILAYKEFILSKE